MIDPDDDEIERASAATLLTGAILAALWAYLDDQGRSLAGHEVREVYADALRRLETQQAQAERDGQAVIAPVITMAREQLMTHIRKHVNH